MHQWGTECKINRYSSGGKARWLGPCRPEFEPPWLRIFSLSPGFAPNNILLPLAWSHKGNATRPVAHRFMVGPGDLTKDELEELWKEMDYALATVAIHEQKQVSEA